MEIGCLIARRRCVVARARDHITSGGSLDTGPSALPALLGAAVAEVTCGVVHGRVAAVDEVAIARRLIGVGCSLVAVRCGLVAVRPRLIGIRDGLIAIGERLVVVERTRSRRGALPLCVPRPVRRILGTIPAVPSATTDPPNRLTSSP
jgi:hypothetical protein